MERANVGPVLSAEMKWVEGIFYWRDLANGEMLDNKTT